MDVSDNMMICSKVINAEFFEFLVAKECVVHTKHLTSKNCRAIFQYQRLFLFISITVTKKNKRRL